MSQIKTKHLWGSGPIPVLAKRLSAHHKGRNFVSVLAIVLTTLMFTALFVLSRSMSRNLEEMAFRRTGYDSQVSFKSVTDKQMDLLKSHPNTKDAGESILLGMAENPALAGRQTEIRWADDSYAEHSFAKPSAGTMPKAADEIALDTFILDRLGIPHETGQTVTLEWRKDLTDDKVVSSSFRLCGYWEGNQSLYASMAWVSKAFADEMISGAELPASGQLFGMHMAQLNLYRENNIEEDIKTILSDTGLQDLKYNVNLAYSPEMKATALQENVPMYFGMALIFLAGYLIIYNIFQISVASDIRFYGKLKTLGTDKKQLKALIYSQANRLCLIGIPIGLTLGYLLGMVLVPVLIGSENHPAAVSADPVIFIGSAVFAWITVFLSCLRPARLAGKISPMEALRYNDSGSAMRKKEKMRRKGASLYRMAWANLGRNKKRTVTVICSLTLGLVLLSCFYVKNTSFDMEKYLSELTISDFELSDSSDEDYIRGYNPKGDTLSEDFVSKMESLEGIEKTGRLYTHQLTWKMNEGTAENLRRFTQSDVFQIAERYTPDVAQAMKEAVKSRKTDVVMYGISGIPLETIVQDGFIYAGTYHAEAFETGRYVLAVCPAAEREIFEDGTPFPTASVGDTITIEGKAYTVMAVVYPIEPIEEGALETGAGTGFELGFILPEDTFRELWPDNTLRKLFIDAADEQIASVQNVLGESAADPNRPLPFISRQTIAEQFEKETRSSAVMGNAVTAVTGLVGILNFINSMVTAIVSRKKEFAMMQSIGMTRRQLRMMLIFEGLHYVGLTLALSYIISAAALEAVVKPMIEGGYTTFRFTLTPLAACTPVLLIFAVLIPYVCFRNIERKSIVERLHEAEL